MRTLQTILDQLPYDALPPAWTTFDLASFSKHKRLWEYQQDALHNALKALWKYYEDFGDYHPGEAEEASNAARKGQMFQWYRHNGLPTNLDIPLGRKRAVRALLLEHYQPLGDKIPFEAFVNRLGFWMATGSGKTLVIVKLIELLWRLARLEEIPGHDILVLTHRDDLLGQLRSHVEEFNAARHGLHIHLEELRNYPQVKRSGGSLFRHSEVTVFTYRSDNLSDVQKEKIVHYRNYDNDGRWFVLLDEAHKGDKEESKRQHIYSILARNGFLFNFSATFTDERDQATTAYDFNLARFIDAGYGKHISILTQENRAFRPDEDYTDEEKQKVVLKALLLLTYAQRSYQRLPGGWYHRPLLLTLVNSVNVKDSDLKLFFRQLASIGKGQVSPDVWWQVKEELRLELASRPELLFERERFLLDEDLFQSLQIGDVLACVFNVDAGASAAAAGGEIEALVRPSNRQEIALSLKAAGQPFALIKIGDISGWLKEELSGYTVVEGYGDDSFFQRLNADDSSINILLGSRSFYEGWDSNRPNVVTFINIGVGVDARKFILQSVGRGVRVEPLPGKRRRLEVLRTANEVTESQCVGVRDRALPLETVFILGTNRQALHTVMEQMDQQGGKDAAETLALAVNEAAQGRTLLIPTYRYADHRLVEERSPRKFEITAEELDRLQRYAAHLADQRLLVTTYRATPAETQILQRCLAEPVRYFRTDTTRRYGSMDVLLPRLLRYFHITPREVEGLKPLADEIRHFQHITVLLKPMAEALRHEIANVSLFPQRQQREQRLREQFAAQQLSFDDLMAETAALNQIRASAAVNALEVRYVANHYYVPVILANDQKIDYIQHVIRNEKEAAFVRQLDAYAQSDGNVLDTFDWWLFSKLDETLDDVHLPYYDPEANRIRQFKPDFVFWLQRGTDYHVVFVDPKGTKISDYQRKVDDYKRLFEEPSGKRKVFEHDGLRVQVSLALYTDDKGLVGQGYVDYWADHPGMVFDRLG